MRKDSRATTTRRSLAEPQRQTTGDAKTTLSRREFGSLLLGLAALRVGIRPLHAQSGPLVFAIIGDYGWSGPPELEVSNLVKSWNPQFIVTNGDNNYGQGNAAEQDATQGSAVTIDANVGQYYHEFLYPYNGAYGPSADIQRFFPILADKDYNPTAGYAPYLEYFNLPGNGRYYEFVWGPVHFFMLNTDTNEPDGTRHPSVQSAWLQARLAASTAPWKVVHLHHPPYSSNTSFTRTQWPFAQWGANVVCSGQAHVYERLHRNGVVYFINGLGGRSKGDFGPPIEGSAVRFGDDYGAQRVTATATHLTFEFITRAGVPIDSYTLMVPPTNLAAVSNSATRVDLTWQEHTTVEEGFEVERSVDGVAFMGIAILPANSVAYSDETASPATGYQYRVRAYLGDSFSPYSNVASVTTPAVTAPTLLTAAVVSSTQINLTWKDKSGNEDGFEVERSTDGTHFTQIAVVGANRTSYADTGLDEGTQYYYRVRGVNALGASAYSNTASATTVPAAAGALTATAVSPSQIDLLWTDNSSNETGFVIERSMDGTSFSLHATAGVNQTSYSDTGLSSETLYYYRIRATTDTGISPYSNTASATTRIPAPTALTATAISTSEINLAWADNSATETGFQIERSSDGTNFLPLVDVGAAQTSYADTELSEGTPYYYRVRAANALGPSAYSNTASATTVPLAPDQLTATVISSSQINLAWADHSASETGFEVERSTDGVNFSLAATVGADQTTYADTGRNAGTTYHYRIRAKSGSAPSAYSNTASATTLLLNPPTGLTATAVSDVRINLAWLDNSNNETGFEVERSTDGVTFTLLKKVGTNVKAYASTALTPGTQYHYRVRAYNGTGKSEYSNVASAATLLTAPTTLTAKGVSTSQIDLTWIDKSGNEDGFQIERSTDGTNFSLLTTVGPNVTSYSDAAAGGAPRYHYRVRAFNAVAVSAYSNVAATSALPIAPTNLTATAISHDTIQLAWQDNATNETGFEIERSTDGVTFTLVKTVGANITGDNNAALQSTTTYYYRVRAYNAGGKSEYTNVASDTTKLGKPPAPSGLTAVAVSKSQVNLAWTDNAPNETGYKVYRSTNGTSFSNIKSLGPNVTSYSDTGRSANTTYYYQVRAFNTIGNSDPSNTATVKTLAA